MRDEFLRLRLAEDSQAFSETTINTGILTGIPEDKFETQWAWTMRYRRRLPNREWQQFLGIRWGAPSPMRMYAETEAKYLLLNECPATARHIVDVYYEHPDFDRKWTDA